MQPDDELTTHFRLQLADDEDLRKEIRLHAVSTSVEAVNQLRRWVVEVITISSAILGAFLALSSTTNNVILNTLFLKEAPFIWIYFHYLV